MVIRLKLSYYMVYFKGFMGTRCSSNGDEVRNTKDRFLS